MNNEFSIAGDRPPFDDGFKNDYIDIMNESKKQHKQGKNSYAQNSYAKPKQDNYQEYRQKQYLSPKTQYPRGDDSNLPHYNKNRTYTKQNFTKNEQFGRYKQPQNILGTGNRKTQPIPTNTSPKSRPQPDVRQFQPSPAAESPIHSFNPQPSNAPSFNPQPKQDAVSTPSPAKEQQTTPNTKTLEFPHGQATDSSRPTPTKDKKPKLYNHTHENQNYHKPKPKSSFSVGTLSGII